LPIVTVRALAMLAAIIVLPMPTPRLALATEEPIVLPMPVPRLALAAAEAIILQARPVALNPYDASVRRTGRLEYRGGLSLSSPDPRFGGLSGILISADGEQLLAVSDNGWWVEMRLTYTPEGELEGVRDGSIAPMRGIKARWLANIPAGDAEALAASPGSRAIVAFETRPKIWRYPAADGPPLPLPMPPGLKEAPANQGIEALTRLADSRLLAITEGYVVAGGVVGWIGTERGGWSRIVWRTGRGFQPTGAATLPDGDVLVLERRILPPGARVRLLKARDIAPGATLSGPEVGRLDGPLTFDNMEGIDARRGSHGETLVYLISDDNYAFFQRTLLLMFRLND
jgi:hypothetical protein